MRIILCFALALPLLADDKPAPPKITAEQQAEYQTLRARHAEAQAALIQSESALKAWIESKRLTCPVSLNGDQITFACPAPKPEPAKPATK